jgi:leader peptidase (prepilin peptidase) / N-methyltransferase
MIPLATTLVGLFVFSIGAAIGSFLNVVIYRIPAGLSILWPPSRCPHCSTRLGVTENIPILGWLGLRGRCRHCHAPIAVRYPLVELVTGLLFLATFITFGSTTTAFGYCIFFSWLLALSLIDLDTMTLPNVLTQSGLVVGLGFQLVSGLAGSSSNLSTVAQQIMFGIGGAALGVWLFDLIMILGSIMLGQPAMGGGDAKLAAMMGAWLGWKLLLVAGFLACAVGAIVGGGAIAVGLLDRRQPMPFGPYLALGGIIAAFAGEWLILGYLQFFFPKLG